MSVEAFRQAIINNNYNEVRRLAQEMDKNVFFSNPRMFSEIDNWRIAKHLINKFNLDEMILYGAFLRSVDRNNYDVSKVIYERLTPDINLLNHVIKGGNKHILKNILKDDRVQAILDENPEVVETLPFWAKREKIGKVGLALMGQEGFDPWVIENILNQSYLTSALDFYNTTVELDKVFKSRRDVLRKRYN